MAILIPQPYNSLPLVTFADVTIPNGGTTPSDCFDMCPPGAPLGRWLRVARIQFPAAWTTATLYFQGSQDGTTWARFDTAAGASVAISVTAGSTGRWPAVDDAIPGIRYLRPYSSVAQGADRAFRFFFIPYVSTYQ